MFYFNFNKAQMIIRRGNTWFDLLNTRCLENDESQQHFPEAAVGGATALIQMLVNKFIRNQYRYWVKMLALEDRL